jgi:subfamily B ATP-binding cassette protein MsbA
MKGIIEIYKYTFAYKWRALLVILCNLLFVIFNLLSIVLFIPVLQLIFKPTALKSKALSNPDWNGSLLSLPKHISQEYEYFMQELVAKDPKDALFFVCVTVFITFSATVPFGISLNCGWLWFATSETLFFRKLCDCLSPFTRMKEKVI